MEFASDATALRAALADSTRAQAAPELAEHLLSLVRPSIELAVPERFRHPAGEPTAAGWYGGLPGLPDGVPWPDYGGRAMTLLAQLDCAALAPLIGPEWTLPRDGLLLFFHEAGLDAGFGGTEGDDGCAVLHVPADVPPRGAPPEAEVIPPLPLLATGVLSAPGYLEPELDAHFWADPPRLMHLVTEIRSLLPTVRHRMLGWIDSAERGPTGHRLLLTLEAEEGTAWGELVCVSFWIESSDLAAGRLSRVRRVLEVA